MHLVFNVEVLYTNFHFILQLQHIFESNLALLAPQHQATNLKHCSRTAQSSKLVLSVFCPVVLLLLVIKNMSASSGVTLAQLPSHGNVISDAWGA